MPDPNLIQETIMKFIHGELLTGSEGSIEPDDNLFTGGLVDSLGIMQLVAYLETTLKIKIPPQDLIPDNFRSVSAMTSYLNSLGEK